MRLALTLAALIAAAPATAQMEQWLPGNAPVISYVNMKDVVAGYGALLSNPLIKDLLEQLHVALPEASSLVTEVGVAAHVRKAPKPASTMVVHGPIEPAKVLAALARAGVELTASVYRGVPLHTGQLHDKVSIQVGFVHETCMLLSLDPSCEHPLTKATIDTMRGTSPSFAQVTGWAPAPKALLSSALRTEALIAALESHGIPSGLVKHIQLATVDALPLVLKLAVDVRTGLLCDTEEAAGRLKTWIKRLNVALVILPGLLQGQWNSLKISQDGRRVNVTARLNF